MRARVWIAMPKANIHHRDTLEHVYPLAAFASDAAQNGGAADQFVRGVRILCAPDNAGAFEFERTTQQVGEASSAAFLAPYRREIRLRHRDTAVPRRHPIREGDTKRFSTTSLLPRSISGSNQKKAPAATNHVCAACGNSRARCVPSISRSWTSQDRVEDVFTTPAAALRKPGRNDDQIC
jgi:hypothetical protein